MKRASPARVRKQVPRYSLVTMAETGTRSPHQRPGNFFGLGVDGNTPADLVDDVALLGPRRRLVSACSTRQPVMLGYPNYARAL